MVRMVRVISEGEDTEAAEHECLARRILPIQVEPGLTMVMALEDSCMACVGESNKDDRKCPDSLTFLRNLESLKKEERQACLRVTSAEIMASLARIVSCVGCRRSVENLHQSLQQSGGAALQPLAISSDGVVYVPKDHITTPDALARLFVPQSLRLSSSLFGSQGGKEGQGRGKRGGSTRCPQHSLGQSKGLGPDWNWQDTWECMEAECREAVVLLPKTVLRQTIDKYLTKHKFCSSCASMVNRAYALLVEKGREPAVEAGEKPKGACPKWNLDGSLNLYSVISACPKEGHVHVQCCRHYVSQLITLAEPHLSGLKQERCAKSIWVAQNEVLICIGIALYERFHNIQQKINEGERTCDLLLLACLNSLRCSLDVAAANKQGDAVLDQLCLELEDGEAKKGKKKKKREKKNKEDCEERDNCRECSVESCLDEEELEDLKKTNCSFGLAVENQRTEAYKDQVCLEVENETDVKKEVKKEKKKKKKNLEQRNRKQSEAEDKRYCEENRSSVESTTPEEEEACADNREGEVGLDIMESEREEPKTGVKEERPMTKAEKKNAKRKERKKKKEAKKENSSEKETCAISEVCVEDCETCTTPESGIEDCCDVLSDQEDGGEHRCTLGIANDDFEGISLDNGEHWFNLDIVNKDFEDIDGNWVEKKKGKKKKKKQGARFRHLGSDNPEERESCKQHNRFDNGSQAFSDEIDTLNRRNKESIASLNEALERRALCQKGLKKDVPIEARPHARPVTLVSVFSTSKCSRPVRSLAKMLEEEEEEVEVVEQIPEEDIIGFLLSADEAVLKTVLETVLEETYICN